MTQLHLKHTHQRSLLDRLTDDEPDRTHESAYAQVESDHELCESVRRALIALFNTTHLGARQDLADFPEVRSSTVNYGIADLAGRTRSSVDAESLARVLREAIERYEPRLIPSSLSVRVDAEARHGDALAFDIEGDVRSAPLPIALALRGRVDFEHGHIRLEQIVAKGDA